MNPLSLIHDIANLPPDSQLQPAGFGDRRDVESLYKVLEEQVIPLFYDRDSDGLPRRWIQMMMNSISSLAWRFSAHRMVMDYAKSSYVPAAGGLSCDMTVR